MRQFSHDGNLHFHMFGPDPLGEQKEKDELKVLQQVKKNAKVFTETMLMIQSNHVNHLVSRQDMANVGHRC